MGKADLRRYCAMAGIVLAVAGCGGGSETTIERCLTPRQ